MSPPLMPTNTFHKIANGAQLIGSTIAPAAAGEIAYDSSGENLRFFDSAVRVVVSANKAQTLSNKTFDTQTLFAAGIVSAPSISVTGDTDTGIFFGAANTLSFATAGGLTGSDANGKWTLGISGGAEDHIINGNSINLTYTTAASSAIVKSIHTDNTDIASHAVFRAEVGGPSGGDPYALFTYTTGGASWSIGADTSASSAFKISQASTLGTNDFFSITSVGLITIGASGGTQIHIVNGDLRIVDNGVLRLRESGGSGTNEINIKAPATLAADYTLTLPVDDGIASQFLQTDGLGVLSWTTASGSGDVVGPTSATDNAVCRFDTTTGKLIQNSVVIIADTTGNISGPQAIQMSGSTSGTLTQQPAATTTSHTITWPSAQGGSNTVLTNNGSGTLSWATPFVTPINVHSINGFRLTTETGVGVSTSNRTAQGSIYLTPFTGNEIALYTAGAWEVINSAEVNFVLSITSGKNYDVFAYDNSGTLTLELSDAWTDDTTRSQSLTRQDGVLVKGGATSRRWVGIIRASGTNITEDSDTSRFVFNAYNKVDRKLFSCPGYNDNNAQTTYTTTSTTWIEANGGTGSKLNFVCDETITIATNVLASYFGGSGNGPGGIAISLDSTTNALFGSYGFDINTFASIGAKANVIISTAGYHFLDFLISVGNGTGTFYADYGRNGASADVPLTYITALLSC